MRHLVTLFIACVVVFAYGHAHFARGGWPASHPWSGLTMVSISVALALLKPREGVSLTRLRLVYLLAVLASLFWIISELRMPQRP